MSTFQNSYDPLKQLIIEEKLSIVSVVMHKDLDLMLVILNTKAILQQKISSFKSLAKGDESALNQFEIIADGKGIHWPLLDEDLSLKGSLQQEIRNIVNKDAVTA